MQPQQPIPPSQDRPQALQDHKIDVVRSSPPSGLASPKQPLWHSVKPALSIVAFIVGVILTASFINAFIFQSYYVEGTSMTPTLHDSDRLIIDKTGHSAANLQGKLYTPNRGDIIVLDSDLPDPSRTGQTEQLIKRVIGLPGERILVENGKVTIYNNDHPKGLNPDEALGLHLSPTFTTERISMSLNSDEVFVIGDNRGPGGSLDSRTFGPVELANIEGKLWARIFPLSSATLF